MKTFCPLSAPVHVLRSHSPCGQSFTCFMKLSRGMPLTTLQVLSRNLLYVTVNDLESITCWEMIALGMCIPFHFGVHFEGTLHSELWRITYFRVFTRRKFGCVIFTHPKCIIYCTLVAGYATSKKFMKLKLYAFLSPRNDAMFTQLHHSGHTCLSSKFKESWDNLQHV